MTIAPSVKLASGKLSVCGRTVLSGVPDAVVVASSAAAEGAMDGLFIGADFGEPASRHVVSLGTMRGLRLMACFRFKLWWMAQRMGDKGGDVPHETQFLLIECKGAGGKDDAYVVFLALVDGAFRASLQGGAAGGGHGLELCVESGDADTRAGSVGRALFVGAAKADPFASLKIWNMNKFTGVLGVYNCQGAAWSSTEKKTVFHQTGTEALTCGVKGSDVHLISEAATDPGWNGDCAVYRHATGDLVVLPNGAALPISLSIPEQDILTV